MWITLLESGEVKKQTNFTETSKVSFAQMDDAQLWAYVKTGEPFGKAGGYGIQGLGCTLFTGIEGCYYNVVGFPVFKFCQVLRQMLLEQ